MTLYAVLLTIMLGTFTIILEYNIKSTEHNAECTEYNDESTKYNGKRTKYNARSTEYNNIEPLKKVMAFHSPRVFSPFIFTAYSQSGSNSKISQILGNTMIIHRTIILRYDG